MFAGGASLVLCFSLLAGCTESSIESLHGRWDGRIVCRGGQVSTISIGFDIDGDSIRGTAITRTAGVNKEWEIKGRQIRCKRWISCLDDSCNDDSDCQSKHEGVPAAPSFGEAQCPAEAPEGESAQSSCSSFGQCTPCTEEQAYARLVVTLMDGNDQITDPELNVARAGSTRLDGTITAFCADESLLGAPQVELDKDQP